jgi:hypothetical protein
MKARRQLRMDVRIDNRMIDKMRQHLGFSIDLDNNPFEIMLGALRAIKI